MYINTYQRHFNAILMSILSFFDHFCDLLTLVLSSISSRRCSPLITRHTRAIRHVFVSGPGTSFSQVALNITVDVFVRSLTESGVHLRAFALMAYRISEFDPELT